MSVVYPVRYKKYQVTVRVSVYLTGYKVFRYSAEMEVVVILSNIRSAHNVGSIFRTSDAAGVRKIFLAGVTPAPIDRFGRAQKEIEKTALGAEKSVPWEHRDDVLELTRELKEGGYEVVGAEIDPRAIDVRSFAPQKPVAILFGREVEGLSTEERAACDALIQIPMRGSKESLNVAVAAGIILFSPFNS